MQHTIRFPIKGTYYYAAELALESEWLQPNTLLILIAEPDNPYDQNAIQIWCPNPDADNPSKLLIGYVPRALAKQLSPYLKVMPQEGCPLHAQVIHRVKSGKQIEIDCQIQLNFSWRTLIKVQWLCFWLRQQQRFIYFKKRFKKR